LALSGPFFLDTSVLLGGLVEIPGRNAGALRVLALSRHGIRLLDSQGMAAELAG
jgi:hypothetical protein